MRLSCKLNAQHLDRMFKKHWILQGTRVPHPSGAAAELEKINIHVDDVKNVAFGRCPKKEVKVVRRSPEIKENKMDPNWLSKECYVYGNNNVLLEGVPQAQLLTKTIHIPSLPKSIEDSIKNVNLPVSIDRKIQNLILACNVLDAEQVRLPRKKIPERPRYVLPREYGISLRRVNRLMMNNFIAECEKFVEKSFSLQRRFISDAEFNVIVNKDDSPLQFAVSAEKIMMSQRALEPVKGVYHGDLPDMFPMKSTISIPTKHVYRSKLCFPLSVDSSYAHPHTLFLDFDENDVTNLHETPVSTGQIQSRSIMKSFAVAAARAKQLYGNVGILPRPIVVQSIQSNGRTFYFGTFQLNTLLLEGTEGLKNYWFHESSLDLFSECGYKEGKPVLINYNKDVLRLIHAFYNNS